MEPLLRLPLLVLGAAYSIPLALASERRPGDGGLATTETGGIVRFAAASERPLYLTSDGSTAFEQPPADALFPITAGSELMLTLDSEIAGDAQVDLWLILYSPAARLNHVRVAAGGLHRVFVDVPAGADRSRLAMRFEGSGSVAVNSAQLDIAVRPALAAVDGQYVTVEPPCSPPPADKSVAPAELPTRLPAETVRSGNGAQHSDGPLNIYLTVDTEDTYFDLTHLMTGVGLGSDYGAYGILDCLDRHGLTATFFVNVYEAHRYAGTVQDLVRDIVRRGHEVGLHTHPAEDLDWYNQPLFRQSLDEQREVLGRGVAAIREWTGVEVVSFRAGGYALNEDTFSAAADVGLRVDSSSFFSSPNNHFDRSTVNAVDIRGTVVEVPVTSVLRASTTGELEHRKFDWDWLSPAELGEVIEQLTGCGVEHAVFMMHSFSFIEKETRSPEQPPNPRAVLRSRERMNRYVEIYGVREEAPGQFEEFLARLSEDHRVRVRTLGDAEADLRASASQPAPDVVPVVRRR